MRNFKGAILTCAAALAGNEFHYSTRMPDSDVKALVTIDQLLSGLYCIVEL
jgi:hypothetical protein